MKHHRYKAMKGIQSVKNKKKLIPFQQYHRKDLISLWLVLVCIRFLLSRRYKYYLYQIFLIILKY